MKVLKVLDMEEFEQERWCFENLPEYRNGNWTLAGLAFRLRDEFLEKNNHHYWEFALARVHNKEIEKGNICEDVNQWANKRAQPIHWIIAALIAKELADGKKD